MLKRFLMLSGILLLMLLVSASLFYYDYQKFLKTPIQLEQALVFNIEPGMSFTAINNKLNAIDLVDKPIYFKVLARYSGKANKIKSGEYQLSPGLKPDELLDVFVSGKVIQYSFTLLEGWQIREMLQVLSTTELFDKTLQSYEPQHLMSQLGYSDKVPEGMFFPDTYHFPKNTTDKQFLQRAYQRLQDVLNEEWQNRAENLPYNNAYEALIMASIIEKETGLASERKTIAGVFVRRLNKKMKLQTDPTVIYAMGQQFNGNIRKKDLAIDSPYNTYRYKGLPPGPIALVGREAIHAALHPEEGKSLYFVSKGDGSHYFSETLREHNNAVAKYQLKK